jgi:hypothetical protein
MKPMMFNPLRRAAFATVLCSTASLAQSAAGPVRQLPAAVATSSEAVGSIAAVRGLPNGTVLVNDQVSRRVLQLDKDVKLLRVVADSTPATNNAYGGRSGGLLGYHGDSTIFVDPASLAFLVIDQDGKIIRTMAAPRPNDVAFMTGGNQSTPGFDSRGRLIYRGRTPQAPQPRNADPVVPDSLPLVRVDLTTRKTDTITYVKTQKTLVSVTRDKNGNLVSVEMQMNNVLPIVDEWAVLTDGTLAVVRGQDYRVDLFNADGTVARGIKIPYDWERLSDERKVELIDSTRAFREKARDAALAAAKSGTAVVGETGRTIETRMTISSDGVRSASSGPPANAAPRPFILPEPSTLPDYRPAFGIASVRTDMENRLWVRTTAVLKSGGGPIYDVIDNTGKRVDRVQLPVGTTIAGFGKGVVYYALRDDSGIHLKKAPIK